MPVEVRLKTREGPIIIWALNDRLVVQTPTFKRFKTEKIKLKNETRGWVAGESGVVMCG